MDRLLTLESLKLIKQYIDEKSAIHDTMFLRCNTEQYATMSEEERNSYLIAIVEEMAELDETDLTNLTEVLSDGTSAEMVMDISENEAISITDEIIGGTK